LPPTPPPPHGGGHIKCPPRVFRGGGGGLEGLPRGRGVFEPGGGRKKRDRGGGTHGIWGGKVQPPNNQGEVRFPGMIAPPQKRRPRKKKTTKNPKGGANTPGKEIAACSFVSVAPPLGREGQKKPAPPPRKTGAGPLLGHIFRGRGEGFRCFFPSLNNCPACPPRPGPGDFFLAGPPLCGVWAVGFCSVPTQGGHGCFRYCRGGGGHTPHHTL